MSISFKRLSVLVLVGGLVAGTATVNGTTIVDPFGVKQEAPSAFAIQIGPGYPEYGVGSLIHSDGVFTYCLEIAFPPERRVVDVPFIRTSSVPAFSRPSGHLGGRVVAADVLTGDPLAAVNYILHRYGQTNNPKQAADVQLAVWKIRGDDSGNVNYFDEFNYYLNNAVARGYTPGYQVLIDEAFAFLEAERTKTGDFKQGNLNVTLKDGYTGVLTVPAGTSKLTVENGLLRIGGRLVSEHVFDTPLPVESSFRFEGRPPAESGWNRFYKIIFNGEQTKTVYQTTYPPSVDWSKGLQQGNAKAGDPPVIREITRTKKLAAVATDPDTVWSPTVSSRVPSEFVKQGESFGDTVTFGVAKTLQQKWREKRVNGTRVFAPITATGTLYGPFVTDPRLNPSPRPPVGAPVAGTATVTTSESVGPGTYTVDASHLVAKETGYYTWVWDIQYDKQADDVKNPPADATGKTLPAIPLNYFFTDGFGQPAETQIVPMEFFIQSNVSDTEMVIGGTVTDSVKVRPNNGGWLRDDTGARIPVTLRGKAYYSETKPVRQAAVPDNAIQVGETLYTTVTDYGDVTSDPYQVPLTVKHGFLSFVWCVLREDQAVKYRDLIAETCDDYGVDSETIEILTPEVTSRATTTAGILDSVYDTAIIEGVLPNLDTQVFFEVFKHSTDIKNPKAVCALPAFAVTDPVSVTGIGEFVSPAVTVPDYGVFYWVENLQIKDPATGAWVTVHRGECGLENETTVVTKPSVSSTALEHAVAGDQVYDIAHVEGTLSSNPGVSYELTFEAYSVPDQTGDSAGWCAVDNLVWQSADPVSVTGVGDYRSELFTTDFSHVGFLFWIETLWQVTADDRTVLHRGECGLENETTVVTKPPVLAATGAGENSLLLIAGFLIFTGLVSFVLALKNKAFGNSMRRM